MLVAYAYTNEIIILAFAGGLVQQNSFLNHMGWTSDTIPTTLHQLIGPVASLGQVMHAIIVEEPCH
jgi:hypothetical protein